MNLGSCLNHEQLKMSCFLPGDRRTLVSCVYGTVQPGSIPTRYGRYTLYLSFRYTTPVPVAIQGIHFIPVLAIPVWRKTCLVKAAVLALLIDGTLVGYC